MLVPITAVGDPRLADYVGLRESTLRRSIEIAGGLFIAEGAKVIRRAIEAGYRPRSFLLAERWLDDLADLIAARPEVPVYLVSEDLAEQVTGFHVHRGALASLHREARHTVADLVAGSRRLVVTEDVVDHANLGAIARSATALGWDGLLLSPRCADPLYRRAVKTSMGAVLSLPWARLDDWAGAIPMLRASGFTVAALSLAPGAIDLGEFAADVRRRPRKLAILLGTEGHGLSARWTDEADVALVIPMAAGVDSLNVAAAAAVACYSLAESAGLPAAESALGETGQSAG